MTRQEAREAAVSTLMDNVIPHRSKLTEEDRSFTISLLRQYFDSNGYLSDEQWSRIEALAARAVTPAQPTRS